MSSYQAIKVKEGAPYLPKFLHSCITSEGFMPLKFVFIELEKILSTLEHLIEAQEFALSIKNIRRSKALLKTIERQQVNQKNLKAWLDYHSTAEVLTVGE